jgi:hypothetical protein
MIVEIEKRGYSYEEVMEVLQRIQSEKQNRG